MNGEPSLLYVFCRWYVQDAGAQRIFDFGRGTEAYATLVRFAKNHWGYFVKVGSYQEAVGSDRMVMVGSWYVSYLHAPLIQNMAQDACICRGLLRLL